MKSSRDVLSGLKALWRGFVKMGQAFSHMFAQSKKARQRKYVERQLGYDAVGAYVELKVNNNFTVSGTVIEDTFNRQNLRILIVESHSPYKNHFNVFPHELSYAKHTKKKKKK